MYPEMSFQWRPISSVTSTSWIQRFSATGTASPLCLSVRPAGQVERIREGMRGVDGHDERLQSPGRERQPRGRGDRRLARRRPCP